MCGCVYLINIDKLLLIITVEPENSPKREWVQLSFLWGNLWLFDLFVCLRTFFLRHFLFMHGYAYKCTQKEENLHFIKSKKNKNDKGSVMTIWWGFHILRFIGQNLPKDQLSSIAWRQSGKDEEEEEENDEGRFRWWTNWIKVDSFVWNLRTSLVLCILA